jgi:hypothetical protein
MSRIALTDGSGTWFNDETAVIFREDTNWDGRNHISVPTGSQWEHEWMYYTKGGKWVLNSFSNYIGIRETYEQIDESAAIEWMVENRCFEDEGIEKLPVGLSIAMKAAFASAEI